jgi:tRNA pseudouridine13 synthase
MRPYLHPCRLGFGFRQSIETFFVEEIIPHRPAKSGRYAIIKIQKEGLSTWELADILRRYARGVTYAGLKDKHATTIQHFGIDGRDLSAILALKPSRWRILGHFKSKRALRVGDLAANRFRIFLRGAPLKETQRCLEKLAKAGVPNYFGYQRFGKDGLAQAKEYIEGEYEPRDPKKASFLAAIYQSDLFNRWLEERVAMSEGQFKELAGEVYRRGARHYISSKPLYEKSSVPTGLLPGSGVVRARLEARRIEERYDAHIHARGARRDAVIYPKEISVERGSGGVWVAFSLPKGSYATIVLENLLGRELGPKGV